MRILWETVLQPVWEVSPPCLQTQSSLLRISNHLTEGDRVGGGQPGVSTVLEILDLVCCTSNGIFHVINIEQSTAREIRGPGGKGSSIVKERE